MSRLLSHILSTLPADDDWAVLAHLAPVSTVVDQTLANLARHHSVLTDWCDWARSGTFDPDGKLGAAYLMGTLSWSVCMVLAHLHLTGHALPALDAGRIGLSRRAVPYTEPDTGAQHEGHVLDLVFGAGEEVGPAGAALDLGRQVELIFADPVGALHRASGLSRAALWRIVGDSLSGAMLEAGQHLGQAERAMDEARAILASRETKLHSRQTHFIRIEVPDLTGPDGAPVCEWFRARGGCCRYYTVEGGEYCTTCVLRNAESRDERLRDYLREKHAGAA